MNEHNQGTLFSRFRMFLATLFVLCRAFLANVRRKNVINTLLHYIVLHYSPSAVHQVAKKLTNLYLVTGI